MNRLKKNHEIFLNNINKNLYHKLLFCKCLKVIFKTILKRAKKRNLQIETISGNSNNSCN